MISVNLYLYKLALIFYDCMKKVLIHVNKIAKLLRFSCMKMFKEI